MDRFADPAALIELLGDWSVGHGPRYQKLARALARAAEHGDLAPGERLPSERALAVALRVSRSTVVAAYDELRGGGVIASRRGSGTRIAARAAGPRRASDGRAPGGTATALVQRLVDGPGELISLAYAVDAAAPELTEALRELIAEDLPELLCDIGYHPRGIPGLRAEIARHFGSLGLPTVAEQILVTTGAHQAIALVAQAYLRRGDAVVVEAPSWPGCLDVFRAAGARVVGVALDDEGISTAGLAQALAEHRPALLYLMPTYHNPTGGLMSASRRRGVAALAARHGVPVLEDNAYAASARAGATPPPMAAFAPTGAAAEVLSVGSLAKAVWGGLRIGWVRASPPAAERLARHKALADLGSPVLDQALAARLLPRLPALTAHRAASLRRRLNHLTGLLSAQLPTWRWREPAGGSALWIELPATDARRFAQVALRHGVEVVPGAAMDADGGHTSHIRLPYTFPEQTLTELTRRLAAAWQEACRGVDSRDLMHRPVV